MQNSFLRIKLSLFLCFAALLGSCSTPPEKLVLRAMYPPPPEAIVVVKEVPLPVVPLYVQGRVMEVEVVQGVQSFLYIKFNNEIIVGEIPEVDVDVTEEELINLPRNYSLSLDMKGDIFSDTQYSEKAGEFVLSEQYGDIYKAKIATLNYIIDRSSLVQIQIR